MPDDKSAASPGPRRAARYQSMVLPDGESLPGNDRSYLLDTIFDGDVSGQTMLDIGSYSGYFCIEGLRRGMQSVTGLEASEERIESARELATKFSVRPEYIHDDFETWETDRTFDVILCLNVLHHMYDPVHAIRRMMQMARRKIVLEVAVPTLGEGKRSRISRLFLLLGRSEPYLLCGHRGGNAHAAARTFLFTPESLRLIFNYHRALFEPIRIQRSPLKQRIIVEAHRRRIRDLTVISGPSGSGKTTFMRRLAADAALRCELGLPESVSAVVPAGRINERLPAGPQKHVLFHYDMLRPHNRSLSSYPRDPATDLFHVAERISFLTLTTPISRLQDQLRNARIKKRKGLRRWLAGLFPPKLHERHRKLLDLYGDRNFLYDRYGEWLKFCGRFESKTVRHLLVENRETYDFHDAARWGELRDALL
jgi:SAM-dependent methyltransferase